MSDELSMNIPSWLWKPNIAPSRFVYLAIIAVEIVLLILLWSFGLPTLIPRPLEIVHSFHDLMRQGLVYELLVSFLLNVEALALATGFSLGFAYLSRFAVGFPISTAVGKMRFLGMTGLTFLFTILVGGGHDLKLTMLTFGVTVFMTDSMVAEVKSIPLERFDHARTLRFGEWHVLYEVVILGTIDRAFEILRQNAAMAWMMLAMVEGTVRSGGGIGTLLLNQDKHFNLALVFAIQFVILGIGLLQDYGIAVMKRVACPYAALVTEGK